MNTRYTLINKYPKYGIDRFGNIYSTITDKVLKVNKNRCGYVMVGLYKDNKQKMLTVHRLVAEAYLPDWDEKLQVNHKNLDKSDNSVGNLEMATCKENIHHAIRAGVHVNGPGRRNIKILVKGVNFEKSYNSLSDAARELNISQGNIGLILRGNTTRTQTKGYTFSRI